MPASLDFTATTVDGKAFQGASLLGHPVLLWFWAPWCPTCRGQLPEVQRIAEQYRGKVTVIGVGSLDNAAAIRRFAADAPQVTHLLDDRGAVWKHFKVVEQSSFVLLDERGTQVFSSGYGQRADVAAQVARVAA